ncbi:MAG: hypothetical protein QG629_278 [Patescibacteria group bacterium]|nr:hypothetical protein [Patescibacteria group bacterium]
MDHLRFTDLQPNRPFLTYGGQAYDLQEELEQTQAGGELAGWALYFFGGQNEEEAHNTAQIYASYMADSSCNPSAYEEYLRYAKFHLNRKAPDDGESLIGLPIAPTLGITSVDPTHTDR